MATAGTNITSIAKPGVGVSVGPTWATDLNTTIDAVDNHDHSTNKGIRITPAAINVNSDVEFNQNSATELKNLIFDASVTAATTAHSIYQASGNLYWRNGAGTAVQITTGSTVNAGAGSIDGMTGTDAGATFVDGAKSYNFFCDSGNTDFGKMAHADLLLYKFSDDNTADTDYITLAASTLASGSSGTVTVPAETGTILTTNTSYAGAVINVATSASNYAINLKPHGTGHVVIGNGSATGKLTSNGAYDLILSTNSGTNSGTIVITDAADGAITVSPNGSGVFTIGGAWTAASQTCANLGTVTTADINGGAIDGTIIGAASAAAGTFGAIVGSSLSVSDGNITNVGDIDCDTISVDAAGTGLDIQFGGNTTLNKISLTDNLADALNINQGGTSYMQFVTTDSGEKIVAGKDLETSVSTNFVERGSCFHSTTNRSLVFGY